MPTALARPGTDLTFFDWPAPREQRGTHTHRPHRPARRGRGDACSWWKERLNEAGAKTGEIAERDGRLTLDFEDPEGQRLSLIDDGGAGEAHPVGEEPGAGRASDPRARADHAERAGPAADRRRARPKVMNMRKVRDYPHPENAKHTVHVYEMGEGGAGAELHVAVQPDLPPRAARARAACITSRSARRTPNTTPGPSG